MSLDELPDLFGYRLADGLVGHPMRRAALRRLTPLLRGPMKRKARRDAVPAWLRPYVGSRDQECVLAKRLPDHRCQDVFGNYIRSDSTNWEMDHIDNGGVGRRVHEKWNVVRLCPAGHLAKTLHASKYRPILREYAWAVEGKVAA